MTIEQLKIGLKSLTGFLKKEWCDDAIECVEDLEAQLNKSKKEIEMANVHIQKMNERDQEILELKAQLKDSREALQEFNKTKNDLCNRLNKLKQ